MLMSILCCCEDFAPSASPKCCVHTASSLMIRTYLASPRSWTDRRRVASVGHCSVRWRHVRRRNTFTCRAKRSIWRISLNELNQNSRESKSILWFRITGLWSFCVNLACYAFIKITLASCHLLLYVVYMCQKKSLNFMDAGLVSLVLRRVEYETLKLSQSLWMHFIVMNKNQWYL